MNKTERFEMLRSALREIARLADSEENDTALLRKALRLASEAIETADAAPTVYDALRAGRLTTGHRWICLDDDGLFTVYERKHYQKTTRVLIATRSEADAVRALLEDS